MKQNLGTFSDISEFSVSWWTNERRQAIHANIQGQDEPANKKLPKVAEW